MLRDIIEIDEQLCNGWVAIVSQPVMKVLCRLLMAKPA